MNSNQQITRGGRSGARILFKSEVVLCAAFVITALLVLCREPLTSRQLALGPSGKGTNYYTFLYGDENNGGNSVARQRSTSPLSWACALRTQYKYGYCGFGLLLDPEGTGSGLDLREYDKVNVELTYKGPGRSLRFSIKNKDQRYLDVGAQTDEKISQTSFRVVPGRQTAEIRLYHLAVAEWWKDSAISSSPELALPDTNNVTSLEFLTGVEVAQGTHVIDVHRITFRGSTVSADSWFGGIAFAWFLLISWLLRERLRERILWSRRVAETTRNTVENIPQMVWSITAEGSVYMNPRWEEFTGASCADGERKWWDPIHPDEEAAIIDAWEECVQTQRPLQLECRMRHCSGEYRWVLVHASPVVRQPGIADWYGSCTDIHDRVEAQKALVESISSERRNASKLKWLSEHDSLTELPNRRAFHSRLKGSTEFARECGAHLGLLLIDLDHFKFVNDTLGHGAGDELLREVAQRIASAIRSSDFAARLGGDEFAVIFEGVSKAADLQRLANGILGAIQAPLKLEHRVINPSATVGGAIYPLHASTLEACLEAADAALYDLKRSRRGGVMLFEPHMLEDARRTVTQLSRAREMIADDRVVALYQPKIDLATSQVVGFEALLRYKTSDNHLETPESISEAFRDYEVAAKIGELMQRRVARDVSSWLQNGLSVGRVCINAAPAEFLRDDFAERLLRIIDQSGVTPEHIGVEVTEHVFMARGLGYVARALELLRARGMSVSLDDFGTGYSSLSHLRDFVVDYVKIDRTFVAEIESSQETAALVGGVIHLARSLGVQTVAEGLETPEQLDLLRVMGCEFAQGYLYSAPLLPSAVPSFIAAANAAGVLHSSY